MAPVLSIHPCCAQFQNAIAIFAKQNSIYNPSYRFIGNSTEKQRFRLNFVNILLWLNFRFSLKFYNLTMEIFFVEMTDCEIEE